MLKSLQCNEGTDFARSKRQTQVISAIFKKVSEQGLIANAFQINDYLSIINRNIETDFTVLELFAMSQKFDTSFDPEQTVSSINLVPNEGYFCETRSVIGAYIVIYGEQNNCRDFLGGSKTTNIYKNKLRNIIRYPNKKDTILETSNT